MPGDMVAASRVEIKRIRVRILRRYHSQTLTRQSFQPVDQGRRAVQIGDYRGQLVDHVTADAAPLLVAGQVIAVDGWLDRLDGRNQLIGD